MAILLVEPCKLVEIVVTDTIATFDRVQLLTSCAKVETLYGIVSVRLCNHGNGLDSHLGIDRKSWVPAVRGYDFTDAVLASLRTNLAHVFHRIAKLFLCRTKGGRVRDSEQAVGLRLVAGLAGLSSPRDLRHVQRLRSSRAEWNCMIVARRRSVQCSRCRYNGRLSFDPGCVGHGSRAVKHPERRGYGLEGGPLGHCRNGHVCDAAGAKAQIYWSFSKYRSVIRGQSWCWWAWETRCARLIWAAATGSMRARLWQFAISGSWVIWRRVGSVTGVQ